MTKNTLAFSAFCTKLGIPLKNARWSWSAHDPVRNRIVFTIWDNEILPGGDSYKLWNGKSDDLRTDNGARELKRNAISAALLPSALDDFDVPMGLATPVKITANGTYYARDRKVREAVVRRAKGRCEYCGAVGFNMVNGKRFLETHHIIHLAKQGPDAVENVIGICPNHHREAHYGNSQMELEKEFQAILSKLNSKVH